MTKRRGLHRSCHSHSGRAGGLVLAAADPEALGAAAGPAASGAAAGPCWCPSTVSLARRRLHLNIPQGFQLPAATHVIGG